MKTTNTNTKTTTTIETLFAQIASVCAYADRAVSLLDTYPDRNYWGHQGDEYRPGDTFRRETYALAYIWNKEGAAVMRSRGIGDEYIAKCNMLIRRANGGMSYEVAADALHRLLVLFYRLV